MGLRRQSLLDFDLQVILEYLLPGADAIITSGTDSIIAGGLAKGIRSIRVPLKPGSKDQAANAALISGAMSQIDGPFRLYLRGHGEWQMMTLGGRNAREVARDVSSLLVNPSVREQCKIISITGCQLALTPQSHGSGVGTNSFAKSFHKAIGTSEQMKAIPVFARTETVSVVTAEIALVTSQTRGREHLVEGSKMTGGISDNFQKGGAKRIFYWQGNQQMVTDAKHAESVVLGLAEFEDHGVAA